MNTTINGQPISAVIRADILRQIQERNPELRLEDYKKPQDVPGYAAEAEFPRYIVFSYSSEKLAAEIRRNIWQTTRLDKNAILDLQTDADGRPKKAVCISSRTRGILWEIDTDWAVLTADRMVIGG